MDALVFAAGEGTRLRPLTYKKPKPLFPVCNLPLLTLTLHRLREFGIRRLILNTHHLAGQIRSFTEAYQREYPGLELSTRYEPEILGTGGGLKNTEDFWDRDPFLVVNGDIVWDLDLDPILDFHRSHGGPVTLVLHDDPACNNLRLAGDGTVTQFRVSAGVRAFTGIQILNREIFSHLPPVGFYDIIPVYQDLADKGIPIRSYFVQPRYWRDMGTPEAYRMLNREVIEGLTGHGMKFPCRSAGTEGKWCLHPRARVEPGVRLEGWGVIGEGTRVPEGSFLRNSILWKNVRLERGAHLVDAVIEDDSVIY